MENDFININKLFVLEKIMAKTATHMEMKVKDSRESRSPLAGVNRSQPLLK